MIDWFARLLARKYIQQAWGDRCEEYDPDCGGCAAWKCFDYLFGDWISKDGIETEFIKVKIIVPVEARSK